METTSSTTTGLTTSSIDNSSTVKHRTSNFFSGWVLTSLLMAGVSVSAAPQRTGVKLVEPIQIGVKGMSDWVREGLIVGGKSGTGFTLLDMIVVPSERRERWDLTFGDFKGEKWDGPPVFFQAHMDKTGKILRLNLSQISHIKRGDVMPRLASASQMAHSLRVIPNKYDKYAILEFKFKKPQTVRFQAASGSSRQLRLELEPRK